MEESYASEKLHKIRNYKSFVWDIGLVGAINFINNFKSLLIVPLLTKFLGAFNYGIWTQIKITIALIIPFLTLGTEQAIIKFLAGESDKDGIREDFFSCLLVTLVMGIIMAGVFFIFSQAISVLIFRSKEFAFLIKLLAILLIPESLNLIFFGYFKAFRYIKVYSKTLFLETGFEIGLIVYSLFKGYGIPGVLVTILITRTIFILIRGYYVYLKIGFVFPTFSKLKKYIMFGIPLVFSSLFFFIINSSNRYLIGYFFDLKQVGIYSTAYFLSYMIVFVTAPIGYLLLPVLSACINKSEKEEAAIYLKYSLKYFFILGVPLIFGISFLSKEILILFSTPDFLAARAYLPLLTLGIFIFQIGVIGEYLNMVFSKNMVILSVYIILALMNTILNIWFMPIFGLTGAALAMLISFACYGLFNLLYCQRFIRFGIEFATLFKILVSSLIMVISLHLLRGHIKDVNTLFFFPISFLSYLISLYLLGCFTKSEVILFKSIFNKSLISNEKI